MANEHRIRNSHSPSETRAALNRAFDRLFERYGSDFGAFYREAYAEIALRREELAKKSVTREAEPQAS
jgi:hypothetical protein